MRFYWLGVEVHFADYVNRIEFDGRQPTVSTSIRWNIYPCIAAFVMYYLLAFSIMTTTIAILMVLAGRPVNSMNMEAIFLCSAILTVYNAWQKHRSVIREGYETHLMLERDLDKALLYATDSEHLSKILVSMGYTDTTLKSEPTSTTNITE